MNENLKITFSIFMAFFISLVMLYGFLELYSSGSFSSNIETDFDEKSGTIFLHGGSTVGRLNSTYIENRINENDIDMSVLNLTDIDITYALTEIDDVIEHKPKLIVYGIAYENLGLHAVFCMSQSGKYGLDSKLDLPSGITHPGLLLQGGTGLGGNLVGDEGDRLIMEQLKEIDTELNENQSLIHFDELDVVFDYLTPSANPKHAVITTLENMLGKPRVEIIEDVNSELPPLGLQRMYTDSSTRIYPLHDVNKNQKEPCFSPDYYKHELNSLDKIFTKLNENQIETVVFLSPQPGAYLDLFPLDQKMKIVDSVTLISKKHNFVFHDLSYSLRDSNVFSDVTHIAVDPPLTLIYSELVSSIILETLVKDYQFDIYSDSNLSGRDLSQIDIENLSLVGKNLASAILTGVDLSGKDLTGTILRDVDLSNNDLSDTILTGADISYTKLPEDFDLSGKDLTGTKLKGVDLSGKDLTGTILIGADLSDTILTGVDLSNTILTRADLTGTTLPDDFDFSNRDLTGTKLKGINFSGKDLTGTILTGADLSNTILIGTTLPDDFDFSNRDLTGTKLEGVDLSGKDLTGTKLEGVDLSGKDLTGVKFTNVDLSHHDFSNAILVDVDFTQAQVVRHANFSNTILTGADFSGVDLTGTKFDDAIFAYADFSYANLPDNFSLYFADLTGTILHNTDLSDTILTGVDLSGKDLTGVKFRYQNLAHHDLSNTILTRADFTGTTLPDDFDFSNRDLTRSIFSGHDLSDKDFTGTILTGADLSDTILTGVDLSGKDLTGTNLMNVDLSQHDLSGTILRCHNHPICNG